MNEYLFISLIISAILTSLYYRARKNNSIPPTPIDPDSVQGWIAVYVIFTVLWPICLFYTAYQGD